MKDGEVEHFENCPVRKEKYEEQVIINSFLYCYERHVPRPPRRRLSREKSTNGPGSHEIVVASPPREIPGKAARVLLLPLLAMVVVMVVVVVDREEPLVKRWNVPRPRFGARIIEYLGISYRSDERAWRSLAREKMCAERGLAYINGLPPSLLPSPLAPSAEEIGLNRRNYSRGFLHTPHERKTLTIASNGTMRIFLSLCALPFATRAFFFRLWKADEGILSVSIPSTDGRLFLKLETDGWEYYPVTRLHARRM